MRLWSLHPKYLDRQGQLALWRQDLLAQKVLQNRTGGYEHHPQLERFKETRAPGAAIAAYLRAVRDRPRLRELGKVQSPQAHPIFRIVRGNVEPWEKG